MTVLTGVTRTWVREQQDVRPVDHRLPCRGRRSHQDHDTEYGLNASVWAASDAEGERIAAQLHCGTVNVVGIRPRVGSLGAPMGGMRTSASVAATGRRPAEIPEAQTIATAGAQSSFAVGHLEDALAQVAVPDGPVRADEDPPAAGSPTGIHSSRPLPNRGGYLRP